MAANKNQPRFEVEDFERLFRALIPDGSPNPFGEINEAVAQFAERFEEEVKATQEYRDAADDDRASIKSRTFGILFLQIFKVLRLFLGFLPQARMVLLAIAVIGLVSSLLDDKEVTLGAIREAVKKTGIADFIDRVFAELNVYVGELATEARDVGDIISNVLVTAAGKAEIVEQLLAVTLNDLAVVEFLLANFENLGPDNLTTLRGQSHQAIVSARTAVNRALVEAGIGGNAASNADVFLTPILRGLDEQISAIPALAEKLVRFA